MWPGMEATLGAASFRMACSWDGGYTVGIVDVINVKHYVDNINRKYTVTMTTTPPTVNIADTLHVPNVHFARGGK